MKVFFFLFVLCSSTLFGQSYPSLLIDNVSTQFSDVSLPYWLKSGQTINLGTNAQSVSILEFNVNGNNLEFSQAISLKTSQTVPDNKVWKIEAIGLVAQNSSIPASVSSSSIGSSSSSTSMPTIYQSPKKFEAPGTYSWTVPPGVTSICVEVWSGGGAGSWGFDGPAGGGGGGGGGAFVYECLKVSPGTTFEILVGAGASRFDAQGGLSKFGEQIIVYGGMSGVTDYTSKIGIGGQPGYSNNNFVIKGTKGSNGSQNNSVGGIGGNGPNGVNQGNIPGGAGNGGNSGYYNASPGTSGARGQVYIYW
jgi:hypothetical protein